MHSRSAMRCNAAPYFFPCLSAGVRTWHSIRSWPATRWRHCHLLCRPIQSQERVGMGSDKVSGGLLHRYVGRTCPMDIPLDTDVRPRLLLLIQICGGGSLVIRADIRRSLWKSISSIVHTAVLLGAPKLQCSQSYNHNDWSFQYNTYYFYFHTIPPCGPSFSV